MSPLLWAFTCQKREHSWICVAPAIYQSSTGIFRFKSSYFNCRIEYRRAKSALFPWIRAEFEGKRHSWEKRGLNSLFG